MSRALTVNRIAGLAALALMLAVTPSCNKTDKPGQAEAVVLVTGISTAGLSVAATADTEATLDYTLNLRNGAATTFFHSVTLTSYSVTFSPPVVAPRWRSDQHGTATWEPLRRDPRSRPDGAASRGQA
jgi:hypothetical protein